MPNKINPSTERKLSMIDKLSAKRKPSMMDKNCAELESIQF